MLAAALGGLFFLRASADDGFISGTNFESCDVGSYITPIDGDDSSIENCYSNNWAIIDNATKTRLYDSEIDIASIAAHSGGSGDFPAAKRPAQFSEDTSNTRYLQINSATETLIRSVNFCGYLNEVPEYFPTNQSYDIAYAPDKALYFDSMVQFAAVEEDQPWNGDDKLLVYLKMSEEQGYTNLVVISGYEDETLYNGNKIGIATNVITNVNVEDGSWHRLTITMEESTHGISEFEIISFGVYIDGVRAKTENGQKEFLSCVGWGYTDITGAGFCGMGAVDDLAFTTNNPFADQEAFDVDVSVADSHIVSASVFGEEFTSFPAVYTAETEDEVISSISAEVETGYAAYITVAEGEEILLMTYRALPASEQLTAAQFAELGGIQLSTRPVTLYMTADGGEALGFANLAEAIDAIDAFRYSYVEIVLEADQDSEDGYGFDLYPAAFIVIDLNGHNITCTPAIDADDDAVYASTLWIDGASVFIIDSGDTPGSIGTSTGSGCSIYQAEGEVTLGEDPDRDNFTVEGDMYLLPGSAIITCGRYKELPISAADEVSSLAAADYAYPGYGLAGPDGDGYYTIQAALYVTLAEEELAYNGATQTPSLQVLYGEEELGDDSYTVTFAPETVKDVGEYVVNVTGTGNYSGTASAAFEIVEADIASAVVTLEPESGIYTGEALTVAISSVTIDLGAGEIELEEGVDYEVAGWSGELVSAGTYTLTLNGIGNFTGTATAEFTISATSPASVDGHSCDTATEVVVAARSGSAIVVPDSWSVDSASVPPSITDATGSKVEFPIFYDLVETETGWTLELNELAIPPLGEVEAGEETIPAIVVGDDFFQVGIPAEGQYDALWYRLEQYENLGDDEPIDDPIGIWTQGGTSETLLIDRDSNGTSGFYKIRATDADQPAE